MSTSPVERTTLPSGDAQRLGRLLRLVEDPATPPPRLIGPGGEETELPAEIYGVLRLVIELMAAGQAVTVAPHDLQLTTQEAAEFLGVSRPTLVRILERGDIPFTKPNRHRRIALADVLAYQERAAKRRRAALQSVIETSEELGLYDEEESPPLRR